MTAKKKASTGEKLKLKKETLKDLDVEVDEVKAPRVKKEGPVYAAR